MYKITINYAYSLSLPPKWNSKSGVLNPILNSVNLSSLLRARDKQTIKNKQTIILEIVLLKLVKVYLFIMYYLYNIYIYPLEKNKICEYLLGARL